MSEKVALFSGTFDPFHVAHTWQLERAYAQAPFDKVVVAVIRDNPKKPQAARWQHRIALAKITMQSLSLPFAWRVESIENVSPASLEDFKKTHIPATERPMRIIGSDSLVEFVQDENLRPVLQLFNYVVTMRPETKQEDVDAALAYMHNSVDPTFNPVVVQIPAAERHIADVSARNLRGNIAASATNSLIVSAAVEYMQENKLYSYA